jgi:hypothetical protein
VKRKGESYLGGHTIITLHPSVVEAGLVEQAREHQRQARNDQQKFDELRTKQIEEADLKEFQSHSPTRRAHQNTEKFYRDQLHQIERALHLNPHPRITAQLLSRELGLLQKLLGMVHEYSSTKRKIRRRMLHTETKLHRLVNELPRRGEK